MRKLQAANRTTGRRKNIISVRLVRENNEVNNEKKQFLPNPSQKLHTRGLNCADSLYDSIVQIHLCLLEGPSSHETQTASRNSPQSSILHFCYFRSLDQILLGVQNRTVTTRERLRRCQFTCSLERSCKLVR